jgi:hypothetical protein
LAKLIRAHPRDCAQADTVPRTQPSREVLRGGCVSVSSSLGPCRSAPAARSKPPVPPNISLLFGHNATTLLGCPERSRGHPAHRASIRRNIGSESVDVHTPTGS